MKPPSSWKDMSRGEGCGERGIDCAPRKSGFWTLWSRFIPNRYGMCHPEIFFWANPPFPPKKLFSLLLRCNRKSWNTQCYLPSLVCFHPPKKCWKMAQWSSSESWEAFPQQISWGNFLGGIGQESGGLFCSWRPRWLAADMFCCRSNLKGFAFQRFHRFCFLKKTREASIWWRWRFTFCYAIHHPLKHHLGKYCFLFPGIKQANPRC